MVVLFVVCAEQLDQPLLWQALQIADAVQPRRRHLALGDRAVDRPLQQRTHQPREVEVKGGHLGVGASVRKVDRMHDAVETQRLAGIEIPAKERVDGQGLIHQVIVLSLIEEIEIHFVAVVQRRAQSSRA